MFGVVDQTYVKQRKSSGSRSPNRERARLGLCESLRENGAPGWTRTSGPELRRLVLYPTELRAHERYSMAEAPVSGQTSSKAPRSSSLSHPHQGDPQVRVAIGGVLTEARAPYQRNHSLRGAISTNLRNKVAAAWGSLRLALYECQECAWPLVHPPREHEQQGEKHQDRTVEPSASPKRHPLFVRRGGETICFLRATRLGQRRLR